MREAKTHTVGDFNYTITQLGAKQGRLVLARVMRAVAGAAGKAAGVADDSAAEAALLGITKLVESLGDDDVTYLCDTFAKTTMVARAETPDKQVLLSDSFDDHFAGRYGAMVKWLWAAMEVNYGSFLGDLGVDVAALTATAKAAYAKSSTAASPTAASGASSSPASAA